MEGELKEVRVKDLYVTCGYLLQGVGRGYCNKTADTAVEKPEGERLYRCPEHRGLIKDDITGPVHETVLRYTDAPSNVATSDQEDLANEW